jgi:hypothetical protein
MKPAHRSAPSTSGQSDPYELTPKQLRDIYIRGTLRQRYRIAAQRFDSATVHPSTLVNAVSAMEGFARAVAVHQLVGVGLSVEKAYEYVKKLGIVDLVEKHICPALQVSPRALFGAGSWGAIPKAVEFRNVLVHEAAFLNGGTCRRLTNATESCLSVLARRVGAI